jgi:hypothetical protein
MQRISHLNLALLPSSFALQPSAQIPLLHVRKRVRETIDRKEVERVCYESRLSVQVDGISSEGGEGRRGCMRREEHDESVSFLFEAGGMLDHIKERERVSAEQT